MASSRQLHLKNVKSGSGKRIAEFRKSQKTNDVHPSHFEESDPERLHALIVKHPLGILVTHGASGLDANHLGAAHALKARGHHAVGDAMLERLARTRHKGMLATRASSLVSHAEKRRRGVAPRGATRLFVRRHR